MKDHLVELLNRKPFTPFKVVTIGGASRDVANPNLAAVGETMMRLSLPRSDRCAILRITEIASKELLESAH